jgi:hypothetical protein
MTYLATAFTNHGQINICCLSVTSLIKARVTDTVCPNSFPNCFYGTWRNNSNGRPRNSVSLFFDKELQSGYDVHSCSAQSLSSFSRLIVFVGYLQSTSWLGQPSQAIDMNYNHSAMTAMLPQAHRYHQHQIITLRLDIMQENSVEWSSERVDWISSSERGMQEDGEDCS